MATIAIGATLVSCKKKEPPVPPKADAPAAKRQRDMSAVPDFIDKRLYESFLKTVEDCQVDTDRSEVTCQGTNPIGNAAKLYSHGGPRHIALMTVSYVFEKEDLAVKTAAVNFLNLAFPTSTSTVPKEPVIRKLLLQFRQLPVAQAVDLAPTLTHVATAARLDEELYHAVDGFSQQRVAIAAYQNLMVEGRLRVFEKIFSLASSSQLQMAAAAVEAPRIMGGRTVEENERLCDWMVELMSDNRPVIQARAGAFLTGCGPKYLEKILAKDEERVQSSKPLVAGLDAYTGVCAKRDKYPFGPPGKDQCERLKKLATTVLNDPKTSENERVRALGILADQFAGKDVLALATRLANSPESPALARRAQDAVRDLEAPQKQKRN